MNGSLGVNVQCLTRGVFWRVVTLGVFTVSVMILRKIPLLGFRKNSSPANLARAMYMQTEIHITATHHVYRIFQEPYTNDRLCGLILTSYPYSLQRTLMLSLNIHSLSWIFFHLVSMAFPSVTMNSGLTIPETSQPICRHSIIDNGATGAALGTFHRDVYS